MDNTDDATSPFENFSSLLRIAGTQVPARAIFLGQSLFAGIYTGTTVGLVCGQFGMYFTPLGPLVPFLLGTGVGFCMGLYGTWKSSVGMVRVFCRNYPTVLAHSMWTEHYQVVPLDIQQDGSTMEDWALNHGYFRLTLCVLAARACERDVREINRQQRQRLIDEQSNSEDGSRTYVQSDINI
jgi:hypothetical protein